MNITIPIYSLLLKRITDIYLSNNIIIYNHSLGTINQCCFTIYCKNLWGSQKNITKMLYYSYIFYLFFKILYLGLMMVEFN